MDLGSDEVFKINLFGEYIIITETIFNTWILMIILILFSLFVRSKLKSFKQVPSGFQNFIEFIVESMENFTIENMGEKYSYFGEWFFTVMTFILFANLSGMIGLRPPTADLATTAALSISTFFLIHFMGIFTGKSEYFKEYFRPIPLLFPINLIGEISTPVSLSFRLFGNVLGGLIIMSMIYNLFPFYLKLVIPSFLHAYFDLFSGSLQAFIFTILSMTFIKSKIFD